MELVKNFGIDPILFIAQIVNFVIVLLVLKRFLYRPVLDMLKQREETINQGQKQAQEAQALLEKIQKEEQKVLQRAKEQAQKMLDDAKKQTHVLQEQMEEHARNRTEKMIRQAKEQIEQETKDAETRLTKNISTLAITYLNKAISEIMTPESQEEIMSKALRVLKKKTN
ncbi:MAG: F0F1 ATP synthase subunit B [Candidatus Levybacteria bacterium]|nr:F0F1 ATP synthase subunit B [Candidatus Levybacteria bacterium]